MTQNNETTKSASTSQSEVWAGKPNGYNLNSPRKPPMLSGATQT